MATVVVLAAQGVHESDAVFQYLPAGQSHAHSLRLDEMVASQVDVAEEERLEQSEPLFAGA